MWSKYSSLRLYNKNIVSYPRGLEEAPHRPPAGPVYYALRSYYNISYYTLIYYTNTYFTICIILYSNILY